MAASAIPDEVKPVPLGSTLRHRTDWGEKIAKSETAMNGRVNLFSLGALSVAIASGCTEQPTPSPAAPVRPAPIVKKQDGRPKEVKTEADWLRAARDPDAAVRRLAVMSTKDVELKADVAVPVLIELLNDADDEVRWHTPVALTKFNAKRHPAIVPALAEALVKDRHNWVRSHAAMALSSIAFDDKDAARPALPALTTALRDKAAQTNAAMALNNFGRDASPAAPALLEALKDRNARTNVLNALQNVDLGPDAETGVPALVECLQDDDKYVRQHAAWVLGRIGPSARAAIPDLTQALKDQNADVATAAAWALERVDAK
jgi:HEAT repeat protein